MDASRRSAMVAARELERGVPWMGPFLRTADLYLRWRAEAIPLRTIPRGSNMRYAHLLYK